MTDKEKIRAEIKRLKQYAESSKMEWIDDGYNQNAFAEDCRISSFDKLLSFIDSLPEPSCPKESDDLDKLMKEVQKYYFDNFDYITSDQPTLSILTNIARYFTEWQKRKMMERAVEGYVNYYEDSGGILMAEAQVGCPYHNGDKVKIIILKDDNERTPHSLD